MENRNITTKIIVCSYDELNEKEKKLIDAAKEATNRSYSPYSRFQVGAAALLSGGTVITGSNQENALTRQEFARNGLLYSMPTLNIPICP